MSLSHTVAADVSHTALTFRTFTAKMSYFIIKKLLLLGKEKLHRNFLNKWSKVNPGVRFGTKAAWLNRGRLHLCACDLQQRARLQLHTCLLITRLGLPAGTIYLLHQTAARLLMKRADEPDRTTWPHRDTGDSPTADLQVTLLQRYNVW